MMIELDEGHRALDTIIERADLVEAADPAEMRLREMALNLAHPRRIRSAWHRRDIGGDEVEQVAPLQRAHLARAQALERNDPIVLMRAAEMQVIGEVPASRRQVAAHHGMRHDGGVLLLAGE